MLRDVNDKLGNGGILPIGRLIVVTHDDTSDPSLVLGSFLTCKVKPLSSVILVNLLNTYEFYYNFCLKKFGIDLNILKEQRNIISINILKDTSDFLLNTEESNSLNASFSRRINIKELFISIKEQVIRSNDLGRQVIILIDSVTVLFSFGVSTKELMAFILYCHNLTLDPQQKCGVVICGIEGCADEDETMHLMNFAKHLSHIRIKTMDLATGNSQDIHGEVHMERQDAQGTMKLEKYHYRNEDKIINLFSPGAVQ